MSKWDVARALKAADLPAPAKLIMWDLLDSADADTAEIPEKFTPSLNDLVRTTGLSKSTVKRELNVLERGGWVVRDRPDPVKARTEFARTGYRLTVPPPRPTVDPGPGARPTVDPDLGPEGDEARPTVGHIPIPHHPDLDQSSSDDRNPGKEQELLAAIVDAVRERTGATVPLDWAPRVRDCILDGDDGQRDVHDRKAYILAAIRKEPDPRGRFLPSQHTTPTAPPKRRPRPPWCEDPTCDEPTRRYERDDGRWAKCPRCHPDMIGATP